MEKVKKADSTESITIEKVKALGKEKSEENFDRLLELYNSELAIPIKREVVSSIGRQKNKERIYQFISERAFEKSSPWARESRKCWILARRRGSSTRSAAI